VEARTYLVCCSRGAHPACHDEGGQQSTWHTDAMVTRAAVVRGGGEREDGEEVVAMGKKQRGHAPGPLRWENRSPSKPTGEEERGRGRGATRWGETQEVHCGVGVHDLLPYRRGRAEEHGCGGGRGPVHRASLAHRVLSRPNETWISAQLNPRENGC
jgi:hypothetical protein